MSVRRPLLPMACTTAALMAACSGAPAQSSAAGEPPCEVSEKFVAKPAEPFRTLTAAELHDAQQARPELFVFDVNRRERFDKGHVPGAVWLAKDEIKADRLPTNHAARVVFYCSSPT